MRFRPCIDLHRGRVKQIVGSTYSDTDDGLVTNFETERPPADFAAMYRRDGLPGGHVIMLGPGNEDAALQAVGAFPGGMHVGGGITPANAATYLDGGASHVIVTSYVFRDGRIDWDRLDELVGAVGRERLVLDISCRRVHGEYRVATDRWQRISDEVVAAPLLQRLSGHCAEFLVHAADVEGKQGGVAVDLAAMLGTDAPAPVTYAGGIRSIEDLESIQEAGGGRVDATVGSALDIFGGTLAYDEVLAWHRSQDTA